MRVLAAIFVVTAVASCGSGRSDRSDTVQVTRMSSGPISQACVTSDRRARNPQLCGCIQTVANFSLTSGDQRKAARFFSDPQRAQDVKMSQSAANDAFWDRYTLFAERSEQSCTGY